MSFKMKKSKMKALFLTVFSIITQVVTLQAQATDSIPAGQIQYAKVNQLPPTFLNAHSIHK